MFKGIDLIGSIGFLLFSKLGLCNVGFYPAHDLFMLDIPFLWYQRRGIFLFSSINDEMLGDDGCFGGSFVLGLVH